MIAHPPKPLPARLFCRLLACCLCAWLFLACGVEEARALDGSRAITQYGHDRWDHQNGLPGGGVSDIYQLPDGYLWMRAADRLFHFDGVRFVGVHPVAEGKKILEPVRAVGLCTDGGLLIRTLGHTLHGVGGEFVHGAPPAPLPDGNERVVFEAADGTIWIGSDNHIYRLNGSAIQTIATGVGWVNDIMQDRQGRLWFATGTGLYRYADDKLFVYSNGFNTAALKPSVPVEIRMPDGSDNALLRNSINAVIEDRDGVLWVGTRNRLYKVIQNRLVHDQETELFYEANITCLLQDRDGNIWVGTDGMGLFRYTRGVWSSLNVATGLSDVSVLTLAEDKEGSLWIGTRSGLDRLRDTPLITLTANEGLSGNAIASVRATRDGSLFVVTAGSGITRLKDGRATVYTTKNGLGGNAAGSPFESRDGALWVATSAGLCEFRDGQFRVRSEFKELAGGLHISAIGEDDKGLIVATSDLGLHHIVDGQVRPYDLRIGNGGGNHVRYTYTLHRSASGDLWFGLSAGLYRVPHGEPPERAVPCAFQESVHVIHEDDSGHLWLASTRVPGVTRYRIHDGQMIHFGPAAGVEIEEVAGIVSDAKGNVWMSTRRGIARLSREETLDYAEGRIAKVTPMLFSTADGMRSDESRGTSQQPAAARTTDGRLYFGTSKGVVMVDPENLPRNTRVPPVVIEEVLVDDVSVEPARQLSFAAGTQRFEIHYTALSLQVPQRVRFQYMLEGYDRDWIDAGSRRVAFFTRLAPGSYRFRVRACNNDGVWNEAGAEFAFQLAPHFYQTWWFLTGSGAALMVAGLGMVQLRTRRLRHREKELVEVVDARTRELRSEVEVRTRAEQELQRYRDYLEQLVATRTAALSEVNRSLQKEISERKQGEEALRQSEDRYRRYFEEDMAGAFIASAEGRLQDCNPAFARIFGFSDPAAAHGTDIRSFFTDEHQAQELLTRVRREHRVRDCELTLRGADGGPVHVLASVVATFDDHGELVQLKGFVVDIAERIRLESQLRQSQKMEAIGQLAGGVAHDFNNLLTAIVGCSDILMEDPDATPEIRSSASEIRDAGRRAAALTRQLLAFSRKQMLQPKVLDLNTVVTDMEKMLRRLIGEDIRLGLELAPDLHRIKADPGQIEQIILNLSLNSRDAMPRGGNLHISTGNAQLDERYASQNLGAHPGSYVRLSVTDTGQGMEPEVQAHIFEPFYTTKGVGKGTGLGLSTVYGIVKQSNGHINFNSAPGRGTTFNIYLPAAEAAPERINGSGIPFDRPAGKETILMVEDNELVLKVAQKILQQQGYTVLAAADAKAAWSVISGRSGKIDLLLTDVIMPDESGPELAQRVLKQYPAIKVLFMSGYTDDALDRIGQTMSDTPLLDKPFTPTSLLQRVRGALDGTSGRKSE